MKSKTKVATAIKREFRTRPTVNDMRELFLLAPARAEVTVSFVTYDRLTPYHVKIEWTEGVA